MIFALNDFYPFSGNIWFCYLISFERQILGLFLNVIVTFITIFLLFDQRRCLQCGFRGCEANIAIY